MHSARRPETALPSCYIAGSGSGCGGRCAISSRADTRAVEASPLGRQTARGDLADSRCGEATPGVACQDVAGRASRPRRGRLERTPRSPARAVRPQGHPAGRTGRTAPQAYGPMP